MISNECICIDCEKLKKLVWNFFIYPFRKEEMSNLESFSSCVIIKIPVFKIFS